MAADWIKVGNDLYDKPETIRLASITGLHIDDVVGKLGRVWGWFDSMSRDGHIPGVTLAYLNDRVRHDGFAEAMVVVGWLVDDGVSLAIPHFSRYMGESAKKRAEATERKRLQRERDAAALSQDGHANHVTKTRPDETRRDVNTNTTPAPNGAAVAGKPPGVLRAVKKPYEPAHPDTRDVAGYHGDAIFQWQENDTMAPGVPIQTDTSKASLEGFDRLLRLDGANPTRVKAVIGWLFRSDGEGYEPKGEFDWRPNVLSGSKVRKHWARLHSDFLKSTRDPE